MNATKTSLKINHADYSNVPSFARVVAAGFAGVCVLPNADVMGACLRAGAGRRNNHDVTVSVLDDTDDYTIYRIDGPLNMVDLQIEKATGETTVLESGDE